jgi:hypothetical protein
MSRRPTHALTARPAPGGAEIQALPNAEVEDSLCRCQMYILDADGTPVHCTEEDFPEWSAYLLSLNGTSSSQTDVVGGLRITTFFLGLDVPRCTDEHPRQPLLWETSVMRRSGCLSENVSRMRHPSAQAAFAWHRYIVAYFRKADGGAFSSDPPPISLRCTDGAPCDAHRLGDMAPEERCPYYCEANGCDQEAVVEVWLDLLRSFCRRHAAWTLN